MPLIHIAIKVLVTMKIMQKNVNLVASALSVTEDMAIYLNLNIPYVIHAAIMISVTKALL